MLFWTGPILSTPLVFTSFAFRPIPSSPLPHPTHSTPTALRSSLHRHLAFALLLPASPLTPHVASTLALPVVQSRPPSLLQHRTARPHFSITLPPAAPWLNQSCHCCPNLASRSPLRFLRYLKALPPTVWTKHYEFSSYSARNDGIRPGGEVITSLHATVDGFFLLSLSCPVRVSWWPLLWHLLDDDDRVDNDTLDFIMATTSRSATPTPASLDLSHRRDAASSLVCCCGRLDCAVLKKNGSVLESVEKDVHTAAQLGQVRLLSGRARDP